ASNALAPLRLSRLCGERGKHRGDAKDAEECEAFRSGLRAGQRAGGAGAMGLRDWGMFLCEFIRHPTRIGAVGPSSQRLARSMVGGIDWSSVKTVLEYGPGTGVFTRQILQVKAADARLVAVEFNRRF